MAIARLSSGEVYANYSDINDLVKPLQVGRFAFSAVVEQKVNALTKPLTREGADYILGAFDPEAESMMKDAGFDFKVRRLGCYVPPEKRGGDCSFTTLKDDQSAAEVESMTEDDVNAYLTPHHVQVNDWHFTFSGAIIKGIQLQGDLQAVVYVTPGEWISIAPTVLNWPIFAFGSPVIGLSYYDREPNADGDYDMELHPENKVMDSMLF